MTALGSTVVRGVLGISASHVAAAALESRAAAVVFVMSSADPKNLVPMLLDPAMHTGWARKMRRGKGSDERRAVAHHLD